MSRKSEGNICEGSSKVKYRRYCIHAYHTALFTAVPPEHLEGLDGEFERLLQSFHFESASSFLDILLSSGAVISGSTVLALALPGVFVPRDLDIYVPSYGAAMVIVYLENHNYKLDPVYTPGAGQYDNGAVVFKMFHLGPPAEINIIIFREEHFVGHIAGFHSTIVMNYVSWYGLVCLYPEWTQKKKGLIVVDTIISKASFKKYEERGFTLVRDNRKLTDNMDAHFCTIGSECPETERCLHDEECAFVPFEGHTSRLEAFERPITWTLPVKCGYGT